MKVGVQRADVVSTITSVSDTIFDRLETAKQETREMCRSVPYLEPRCVDIGDGAQVASFDLADLIEHRLQNDTRYRQACLAKSDKWKEGDKWMQPPTGKLDDFDDAVEARFHPHLMRPAADEEEDDLRIAINLNADDVEA